MIGYFMTKPNQGAEFKIFRDQFMGVTEAQDTNTGKTKNITNIK